MMDFNPWITRIKIPAPLYLIIHTSYDPKEHPKAWERSLREALNGLTKHVEIESQEKMRDYYGDYDEDAD